MKKEQANHGKSLFIDVHNIGKGKVHFTDVAEAHKKDLKAEKDHNVNFIQYWVDEKAGKIYCLSEAPDSAAIKATHAEAHGMLPEHIYKVAEGTTAKLKPSGVYYLDTHHFGRGEISAEAVAKAHKRDLAVEGKYGVKFINYWIDEKNGVVMCLSQAPDSAAIVATHKEANGIVPISVEKVIIGE